MITIGILLVILILACIIGNLFVILAILMERDLKGRIQNYLIFSLAVADLMVGLIVTPLGAWSTVTEAWTLGVALCDFWISVDVLVCTSSILHLVAIALDRYWSITDITYVQNRTPKRIFGMLSIIWLVSLLISLAPMLGWKDSNFYYRVTEQHVCLISQQISYQVFSTATAFYIPLCAIICIYYKIMRAAKRRFKRERERRIKYRIEPPSQTRSDGPGKFPSAVLIVSRDTNATVTVTPSSESRVDELNCEDNKKVRLNNDANMTNGNETSLSVKWDDDTEQVLSVGVRSTQVNNGKSNSRRSRKSRKENLEMKRERKAWRTLVIITGTFVACWTPFFLVSLYRPLCACQLPSLVESVTLWLGYLNSVLNPIIYTVFSRDFRAVFKRILSRMFLIRRKW